MKAGVRTCSAHCRRQVVAMVRPLRIEFEGAIYHVTSRGNARSDICVSDEDREIFLTVPAHVVDFFGWVCHAYCLRSNQLI